jgi:hypothetical protein
MLKRAVNGAQVTQECLHGKCKALSSNPSAAIKKKEEEKQDGGGLGTLQAALLTLKPRSIEKCLANGSACAKVLRSEGPWCVQGTVRRPA